jgi:hypothetical protein
VFVADDRFARDFYRQLTGTNGLMDALAGRELVALEPRAARGAMVLSARGSAPARLTLARFHAPQTCGFPGVVTELVLAFQPGGGSARSAPPSHVAVVALLDEPPVAGHAAMQGAPLSRARSLQLVHRVAQRAQPRGTLELASLTLDPDKAADAGEVLTLRQDRYAVGLRARFVTAYSDTVLVTGVAVTDTGIHTLHWIIGPLRSRLSNGMTSERGPSRYSLRGVVTGAGGDDALLLLDEIADVAPRESRAAAVDPGSRRVIATQPLALRCP